MLLLYVAVGSAIGGAARYLVATLLPQPPESLFPIATTVVNVTGSLVLGLVVGYAMAADTMRPEMRAFLAIGICGGYTTFSAFSLETVMLLQKGRYDVAAIYIAVSVALSVTATIAGVMAAQQVAPK